MKMLEMAPGTVVFPGSSLPRCGSKEIQNVVNDTNKGKEDNLMRQLKI